MKVVIVGGVAGGASAAARLRRLDADAEIVLFERGREPSFANCGMPYYIGGEIETRDRLLVASETMLRQRHRIDVRTRSNVLEVNREAKTVVVEHLETAARYEEPYDKLILATGAAPFRPPLPGVDLPGVYTLRDLNDADRLHSVTSRSRRAVIIGAGFIGVEMAENLRRRQLDVVLVELADQILPPWDREMTAPMLRALQDNGVTVKLSNSAEGLAPDEPDGLQVRLQNSELLECDFVVLCIGVRPDNRLAVEAGLACGPRGGVVVNRHMQTEDPDIYAVGDVVQVQDVVSGRDVQIPLAGPANRQGRIAADHLHGRDSSYRGTQGTAVVGVFDKTAAMTGLSEKLLKLWRLPYEKVYLHPLHHAGYFPGGQPMSIKLLFDPASGRLLGAQAVGGAGVDKRIDVLSMAIQAGLSVYDLEEAELCYAPQYGSAKDPLNMAGFIGAGVLRGDQPVRHSDELEGVPLLVDVRTEAEFQAGAIPGAIHLPLDELHDRLNELQGRGPVVTYCQVGARGYLATRMLLQGGVDAANLSGGYATWKMRQEAAG